MARSFFPLDTKEAVTVPSANAPSSNSSTSSSIRKDHHPIDSSVSVRTSSLLPTPSQEDPTQQRHDFIPLSASTGDSEYEYESSSILKALTREDVETLFVEMCTFGRLGFLQPPGCLSCAYRLSDARHTLPRGSASASGSAGASDSSSSAAPKPLRSGGCDRYVVWRKDASRLIDGEDSGNMMLLTCRSAKKLLRGETVKRWKWCREEGSHGVLKQTATTAASNNNNNATIKYAHGE